MRIASASGEISSDRPGIDGLIAQAQQAERDGFATGWFRPTSSASTRSPSRRCADNATTRLELGTAVVPTYPRHPFAMAQQALTAQAACNGRFTLGIGLSHQIVIEAMLGLSYAKSYSHMRDYLAVLAPLIRTGSVSHSGSEYRVAANLTIPGATPCPILVAALAPKMLALAGSVGDGYDHLDDRPKTLRDHTIPRIREAAAAAAGRRRASSSGCRSP
jgi:alkanesulfonate monooxygenase SsuD/methylene tetrahydromethanopterin reductase-like flavin-dependent oxidoreductase (luciferase family)